MTDDAERYDRAEIVEDHTSDQLRVYFFRGDERVSGPVYDLRWDYADADIDEIRIEITANYGIPPTQISKHAYQMDLGVNTTAYIDTFFRNINWEAVLKRIEAARNDQPLPNEDPSSTTDMPSLSVEELAAQIANGSGVQIVDARQRDHMSRNVDLMAGSTWRDPDRVEEWITELRPDKPVAVYCSYGFDVGRNVTKTLIERGFAARGTVDVHLSVLSLETLLPGQRVQKVLSRWCGGLWRGLFSDRDSLDVIERGGNHDLHPSAPGSVHPKGGAVDGGRPGLNEPQLIRALATKRSKPADGEVPASVHGHEETGARFRLPCSGQDHDAARTARQRLDLRSRRRPRRAASELALERDVPDQERR